MTKLLPPMVLCLIVFLGAGPVCAQQEKTVWVLISDERGQALPGVVVSSRDYGKTVRTGSSGKIGVPVSSKVRSGDLVQLIISSNRYKTITGGLLEVRAASFDQPAESIPITLVPKGNVVVRANNTTRPRTPRPAGEEDPFQRGSDALAAQRYDDALKDFLRSAEIRKRNHEKTPNKLTATQYGEVSRDLSRVYMILNKWNAAFEHIQEAKRVHPTDDVKFLFGIIAITIGELSQAEPVFRELASSKNANSNRPVGSMFLSEIYREYGKLDESSRFDKAFVAQIPGFKLSENKALHDLLSTVFETTKDMEKDWQLQDLMRPLLIQAFTIFHKANIADIEKKQGAYSPPIVQALLDFSSVLQAREKHDEAERVLNRAISVLKRLVGPSHLWLCGPLQKLAEFETNRQEFAKAEAYYREMSEIVEKSLEQNNRWVDEIDRKLAELYEMQERDDEAEAKWQSIRRRHCSRGGVNMTCLYAVKSLSDFYRSQSKYPEAIEAGREAVQHARQLWAAKDLVGTQLLLEFMGDLREIYELADKPAEAEALEKERQDIADLDIEPAARQTEAEHQLLPVPRMIVFRLKGRSCSFTPPNMFVIYPKAKAMLEAAGRAAKQVDNRDPDVAKLMFSLGEVYFNENRLVEAERLATGAINDNEAGLEPNRHTTALLLGLRGAVRAERGDLVGAAADYSRVIKTLEILDPEDENIASGLFSLGRIQIEQQKFSEAEKNLKRALDLRETNSFCSYPDSVTIVAELGVLYLRTGRLNEAETNFKLAVKALGDEYAQHSESVSILENYARCLRELGKPEEALKLELQAEKLKPKKK